MSKSVLKNIFRYFYSGASFKVRFYIKLILFFKRKSFNKVAVYFANRLQKSCGVFISPLCSFDESLVLKHPVGIVLGDGVVLGRDVVIYQNVTLGGARVGDGELNNYPTIGDGCIIFAGAVLIGKVNIGENCVIGANAVVINDVPANCRVAGVPARIIGINKDE